MHLIFRPVLGYLVTMTTKLTIEPFSLTETANPNLLPFYLTYLRMRKQVFVDSKMWPMPVINDHEFDQYDLPFAKYLLAVEDNKLVGGCRLVNCSNKICIGSTELTYMMLDAQLGRLPGISNKIANCRLPTTKDTWELTRVVSSKNGVGFSLIKSAYNYIKAKSGTECIFFGPPAFTRFGRRIGIEAKAIGPLLGDKILFQAMSARIG